jgi:hypothetical protein
MRLLRHSQEPFGVSGKVHQNSTARLAAPLVGADLSDRDLVATGTCIPAGSSVGVR